MDKATEADMLDTRPKATCQFQRANGEYCKKQVAHGEAHCHWHANGLRAKIRSLERSHKVGFWMTVAGLVLALVFGLPEVYWHYHTKNMPTNIIGTSSGDNSPNIIDNQGSVTIQNQKDSNHTDKSKKESGEKK